LGWEAFSFSAFHITSYISLSCFIDARNSWAIVIVLRLCLSVNNELVLPLAVSSVYVATFPERLSLLSFPSWSFFVPSLLLNSGAIFSIAPLPL
jgi:hypothetical protein